MIRVTKIIMTVTVIETLITSIKTLLTIIALTIVTIRATKMMTMIVEVMIFFHYKNHDIKYRDNYNSNKIAMIVLYDKIILYHIILFYDNLSWAYFCIAGWLKDVIEFLLQQYSLWHWPGTFLLVMEKEKEMKKWQARKIKSCYEYIVTDNNDADTIIH